MELTSFSSKDQKKLPHRVNMWKIFCHTSNRRVTWLFLVLNSHFIASEYALFNQIGTKQSSLMTVIKSFIVYMVSMFHFIFHCYFPSFLAHQ